jgi:hypothetical protein
MITIPIDDEVITVDASETMTEVINPVVEVNGAFNFGIPTPMSSEAEVVSTDNTDIPTVPEPKVKSDNSEEKASKNNKRNDPKYKARQIEYQSRVAMARETAPYVAMALNEYVKTRGVEFDTNDASRKLAYWVMDSPKGEIVVKGTVAEAMSFHGLAGVGGISVNLMEWIEKHPAIFGMFYIAGLMLYLETVIQAQLQVKARDEAADNVAIPKP